MRLVFVPVTLLALAQACTVVNSFGPVKGEATTDGGTGGQGGSGGAATTGGGGGESGQGGSGGSGGSGGVGGMPEPCALGDIGVCGPTNKCTVTSFNNGLTGCIPAGPKTAWHPCTADAECADGLWCDTAERQVCRPICDDAADCANDGRCIDSPQFSGLKVCTSNCYPVDAAPCAAADGGTCLNGSDGWDCGVSAGGGFNTSCTRSEDCAPGLVCVSTGMGNLCKLFCAPLGTNPSCSGTCNSLGATHNGTPIGACEQP